MYHYSCLLRSIILKENFNRTCILKSSLSSTKSKVRAKLFLPGSEGGGGGKGGSGGKGEGGRNDPNIVCTYE
jgi:uncharacterized membrane protein